MLRHTMTLTLFLLTTAALAAGASSPKPPLAPPDEVISTYSILGYDPQTGDVGIAIASRVFNVSSFFGKAGVGVVTLQHSFSGANLLTATEGVKLLEMGFAPAEVVRMLMSKDEGREFRQIGVIDAKGRVAAYTGPRCTLWSGDRQGTHYTTQGNILTGKETTDAMAETFESTQGELAEKLMAALLKADTMGGDARGKQSASLRVFRLGATTSPGTTVGADVDPMSYYVDLRVMDHEEPVREMARLWQKTKDNRLYGEALRLFNQGKKEEALAAARELIKRRPNESNGYEALGILHYHLKQPDEAIKWLREAAQRLPRYQELFQMRMHVLRDRVGTPDPTFSVFKGDPDFVRRLFAP
jgi:uncharacterized Ntn-hydrolase superfamily protein